MKAAATAEFIEKKSKFIGHIMPVQTQAQTVDFINEIKAKHPQATHNVYAYVLRQDNLSRFSDDSEPAQTAGLPVLQVMLKNGVTDCAIVVTRYFGGTLLGTGGLRRAYTRAAALALSAGGVALMAMCTRLSVGVDYSFYDSLLGLFSTFGCEIIKTEFTHNINITFLVKSNMQHDFLQALSEKSAGRFHCTELGCSFSPVSLSTTSSG
ncbi:MAG: YigZ family protein [Clostridiales bacterium]|nr:YigZ family protein [Clostridiales bacterium]